MCSSRLFGNLPSGIFSSLTEHGVWELCAVPSILGFRAILTLLRMHSTHAGPPHQDRRQPTRARGALHCPRRHAHHHVLSTCCRLWCHPPSHAQPGRAVLLHVQPRRAPAPGAMHVHSQYLHAASCPWHKAGTDNQCLCTLNTRTLPHAPGTRQAQTINACALPFAGAQ